MAIATRARTNRHDPRRSGARAARRRGGTCRVLGVGNAGPVLEREPDAGKSGPEGGGDGVACFGRVRAGSRRADS